MIITRTPFRISFFGGGTDYPIWYKQNGGAVISTSIDKYCYLTTRYLPPFFRYRYRIRYTKKELVKNLDQIKHPSVRECLKFIKIDDGVEIIHTSDLPSMSGLGSSSAFTVGLLKSLYGLLNRNISTRKLAEQAIHVEQNLIKENVGSQDQVSTAYGGFNKIIFKKNNSFFVKKMNINQNKLNKLNHSLLLIFTGFQRYASDIALSWIQNAKVKEKELLQLSKLALEAEKILTSKNQNLSEFGKLLDEHWNIKKSMAVNISNNKIDEIYMNAKKAGALGGKLLGAGSGGFMIFFVEDKNKDAVKNRLRKLLHVPFKFEDSGSKIVHNMPSVIENGYKG